MNLSKRLKKTIVIVLAALCVAAAVIGILVFTPVFNNCGFEVKEDICIDTPYGTLHYPEKWKDNLEIEKQSENNVYSVIFYGDCGEQKEKLFTVNFGETECIKLGSITSDETSDVKVGIEFSDFVPDDSWSKNDTEIICTMQEDVNYTIEKLQSEDNFKK